MYDEALLRKRIKAERQRREWTQERLAEELTSRGVPARWSTIAKIEAGPRRLSAAEAVALADAFEMPFELLAGQATRPTEYARSIRRGYVSDATDFEQWLTQAADALGEANERRRKADPEGLLADLHDAANLLHAQLRTAVLSARQVIRKGESE
jgi:transcriptional regulator with XRE-family HTH domain